MGRFSVILPAAGKSARFGGTTKKVFQNLEGRAVWLRTADLFLARKDVVQVIVVIGSDDRQDFLDRYAADLAVLGIDWVEGGDERFDSVRNAIERIDRQADFVAVHDAARPCVTDEEISAVFQAAEKSGAAILGTPIHATIKRVADGKISQTVDRQSLWAAQTPQVFAREKLEQLYRERSKIARSSAMPTDDAQLFQDAGQTVDMVPGRSTNLKITSAEDMLLARAIWKSKAPTKNIFHPFAD